MAETGQQQDLERSEEATPKRREEARAKGQFPRSTLLLPVATLAGIALALRFGGAALVQALERCLIGFINAAGSSGAMGIDDLFAVSARAGWVLAPILGAVLGAALLASLGFGFMQSGFVFAAEPFHLDWSRVSPLAGFGRLFSADALGELAKSTLFLLALGTIGFAYLSSDLPALAALATLTAQDLYHFASARGADLLLWIAGASAALAGIDYLYQYWRTQQRLRMSRQEVKDEMREQEGDPQLKGRLKGLRQKMSRRQLGAEVARADVVITNPTHLAVALRYRAGENGAPKVVGKGAGLIAARIREIARSHSIPIVENKPLARLLYRRVEVGREVPEKLYRAVAEVLAYVYRLRRGERGGPPQFTDLPEELLG
jgi:flagellar biosynthetic protein FlhB